MVLTTVPAVCPKIPTTRGAAATLMVLILLASACGSQTANLSSGSVSPTPTESATTVPPTTVPPTTVPPTTAPTPDPADQVVIVGDSVALQVSIAAQQRAAELGGPQVDFLLAWGPGSQPERIADLHDLIDDPATAEIVASFGVWQALPPEAFELEPGYTDPETYKEEVAAFLEPMMDPRLAGNLSLLLLDSIDVEGDEQVQLTNALIEEVAAGLDLEVRYTMPGRLLSGAPTTVRLGETLYPVRAETDGIHFCAAGALAMADRLLAELGLALDPPDEAAVETVYEMRPENFSRQGCEPLTN